MEKFNPPNYIKAAIYGMACTLASQDGKKELQATLAQVFFDAWDGEDTRKMSDFLDMVKNYGK